MTPGLHRHVLAWALASLLAAPGHAGAVERSRWLMGTLFTFRAPEAVAAPALEAALDSVGSLETRLSNWRPSSELSLLNAAGSADLVSEPLLAVVDSALALAAVTGGMFDPTVEPLTRAWDLRGAGRVPDAHELADALSRVDWCLVRVSDRSVRLGGAQLDLGGIGKGFALDRAARILAEWGVRSEERRVGKECRL